MHRDLKSPPTWPAVCMIVLGLALLAASACARDDGMTDLYRGVKRCNDGGCNAVSR